MSAKSVYDAEALKAFIRDVPDFPKPGIVFKDITPLLKNKEALRGAIDEIASRLRNLSIDLILGIESRGFILGPVLSYCLGTGFAPVRKNGKLPHKKCAIEYSLEYGKDKLEIHEDAVSKRDRVLVVDDLLATGGTAKAVTELVEKLGGRVVGLAFLVELAFLKGREKLKDYDIESLIIYS